MAKSRIPVPKSASVSALTSERNTRPGKFSFLSSFKLNTKSKAKTNKDVSSNLGRTFENATIHPPTTVTLLDETPSPHPRQKLVIIKKRQKGLCENNSIIEELEKPIEAGHLLQPRDLTFDNRIQSVINNGRRITPTDTVTTTYSYRTRKSSYAMPPSAWRKLDHLCCSESQISPFSPAWHAGTSQDIGDLNKESAIHQTSTTTPARKNSGCSDESLRKKYDELTRELRCLKEQLSVLQADLELTMLERDSARAALNSARELISVL